MLPVCRDRAREAACARGRDTGPENHTHVLAHSAAGLGIQAAHSRPHAVQCNPRPSGGQGRRTASVRPTWATKQDLVSHWENKKPADVAHGGSVVRALELTSTAAKNSKIKPLKSHNFPENRAQADGRWEEGDSRGPVQGQKLGHVQCSRFRGAARDAGRGPPVPGPSGHTARSERTGARARSPQLWEGEGRSQAQGQTSERVQISHQQHKKQKICQYLGNAEGDAFQPCAQVTAPSGRLRGTVPRVPIQPFQAAGADPRWGHRPARF